MDYSIRRAVVIGAGTMGAQIAAHLTNAGVKTTLLDIVPSSLTPEEEGQGLGLRDRAVRNRIAREGLTAAQKARPAAFFTRDGADRVQIGNIEDDLALVGEADWVVEAIIEDLEIKRGLMRKIDALRGERTIISTNTSGIPVRSIAEGLSEGFQEHFLGTHFFNPPRYLKLLEIIPAPKTSAKVLDRMTGFAVDRLGKGVVLCKDTPNFIANRLGSVSGAFLLDFVLEHGYTVEEVDALTGTLIGRPKTATFRLLDLVGIDVSEHVRRNLAGAVPDDGAHVYLVSDRAGALMRTMIERGWLGNKTGVGFYKRVVENGTKVFWPLDLQTLEHRPALKPEFESVDKAKSSSDPVERLLTLLAAEDRAGALIRALVYQNLAYASKRIPEIAETPLAIDQAVRWGFMHHMGPFEIWDQLSVEKTSAAMQADGFPPAAWVGEMLASGRDRFYRSEANRSVGVYLPAGDSEASIKGSAREISLAQVKATGEPLDSNDGATLIDIGDDVVCLELHAQGNAIDEDVITMMNRALDRLETMHAGLVITGGRDDFSFGANLFAIAVAAQNEMWDQLEQAACAFQELAMRLRYFPKPVVMAPAGRVLGGGCELMMSAPRVVAAAETYPGLVEVGVGLIPGGSGSKEMLRRIVNPGMRTENASDLPFLQRVFETIGQARVGTSAEEARQFGYLSASDRVVMNRDHLIHEAKREVLHMAPDFRPPVPEKIYAGGRDALAAMRIGVFTLLEGGYISEHDALIGEKLATILAGGDLSRPAWVDEWYILDLEREAILSLAGEEKTQQRMWHTLQTGKPLRN